MSSRPQLWMSLGLVAMACAFCLLASFTHQLLNEKGSLGSLKNIHNDLLCFHEHPVRAVLLLGMALASGLLILTAVRLSRDGQLWRYFGSRLGSSVLLLSVAACQLPMFFTQGPMDRTDVVANSNALGEAGANYRIGEWPFYTFHFANGTTLGLQYPMFRTLWGGMFYGVSPLGGVLNFQILCALAQVFLIIGLYRMLRAWRFSRITSVIPALVLAGCHQMLLFEIWMAYSALIANAFAVWCFQALARWLVSARMKHALACGFWLGFAVLGHPVTALFIAYFIVPVVCWFVLSHRENRARIFLQGSGAAILSALIALQGVWLEES